METPLGIVPALIPNALWVPELAASLLSVARFTDHGKHNILFDNDDCFIRSKPSGKCVASEYEYDPITVLTSTLSYQEFLF